MAKPLFVADVVAQLGQARRHVATLGRRRPPVVTIALIIAICVTFARLEVGYQLPTLRFVTDAFSPRALIDGRFGTLGTATMLTRDPFMVVSICVSLLVTMGTYEVLAGHLRATVMAIFAAAAAPALVTVGLMVLDLFGSVWAQGRLETLDIGASTIVAGTSGAITAVVRDRRLTSALVLFLLGGLLLHHQLADWEHVAIFPWGYLAGRVLRTAPIRGTRVSRRRPGYPIAVIVLSALLLACTQRAITPSPTYRSASGATLSAPRMVTASFPTPSMGGSRSVLVLLPPGYDSNPTERYPVVELLHGDPGSAAGLITAGDLLTDEGEKGVAPFIGIAPNGNDANRPSSWFANVPGHQLGTAVTRDLRAWAAQHLRTSDSWSFAGLSSGGFAAGYLPTISTQPVHATCALSGYYDGHVKPLERLGQSAVAAGNAIKLAQREPTLVFIAYGDKDPRTAHQSSLFADALRRAHKHVVLTSYPGGHTWSVWRAAFLGCLRAIVPG
jgi:enterochelin esterase-like enzyme